MNMSMNEHLQELLDLAAARRTFVRGSMAIAGSLAATSAIGLGRAFAQDLTDVDILQFALTLEHLEARMYQDMLATGILSGKEMSYLQSFGEHEAAHVDALANVLSQLGETPAQAQESYNFPPFDSREAILGFAKVAEDVGVGAYQGAAAFIENKAYLAAAGSIVQVEARHAAIINLLSGLPPVPASTTPSLTIDEVNAKVGPILGQ